MDESGEAQLARVLHSRTFSQAPTLSRLLRYLVEHTLERNAEQLKEYSLGAEFFRRGESFDPRTDTIVRVHARRLRRKLKQYYDTEGQADAVVIELPKGHYVVTFRTASPREHDSTLHLVENFETYRDPIDEAPRQMVGSRPPALPAPRTALIGREQELAAVKKLLISGSARLITLTGAGGSGKTRLGLQVATQLIDEFPGGVYFVVLASITDPGTVASTIAQALGVRHTGGKPLAEALQDHLRLLVHAPTLLLLDNFEHLLAAAPLVGELLEACAPLKVLVTSRAVLHVYGEYEYPVPPLPVPELEQLSSLEVLAGNPAVTLFVERAAAVKAEFALTEENAPVVAQICCRVDGLPLAIELAAARVKMLSPAAVLARLQSRLELLTCGAVDMPARQQTLRRTIDWSHDLLNTAEQKLFRRLSVFVGGCTLEAAEAVCNTRYNLEIDVLEGMASLVDKSLVQQVGQKDGEVRFTMLETIREYGLDRLAASGEKEVTQRAHAAYCMVLAEEGNPPLTTAERTNWLALCDIEHDNLRAALDWLIASENYEWASRLGLAFYWFWEPREHLAEGRELVEAILKMRGAQARTKARAKALTYAANLMANQGDYPSSFRLGREALDIYHELGDTKSIAGQLNSLGINSRSSGDYASARSWFERSLQVCRELGDGRETAAALSNLAESVRAQGDPSLARALLEEALSLFCELGDAVGVAWSFNHLGDVARDRRDLEEARRLYQEGADALGRLGDRWGMAGSIVDLGYLACEQKEHATAQSFFEEALKTFLDLGHMRGVAKALEGFACLAANQQNSEHALTLAGAAAALRHTMRAPARPDERAILDRVLKPAWQHWDPAASKAIWTAGWKMPLEQAIQCALDRPHAKQASSIQS